MATGNINMGARTGATVSKSIPACSSPIMVVANWNARSMITRPPSST
eukprot:CAMPEP_0197692330 /NCGR_PEP_ID=MMETSP1338-20131121/110927_1 /TAXON_ID=43686 ORGANISM="Pelagodinium beii, Strain RCC1491" /NCGR_SAMPLE_ID=MMETSP1338 /ASSEMBLY_ACC=CAM_ASM_000754 /LENGTH=46 /DNA_ID= /DNA_START= /DNA_END= /DNA_ORIENTATION=